MNPPNLTSSDLKPDEQAKLTEIEVVKQKITALIASEDQAKRNRGSDLLEAVSKFAVTCRKHFGNEACVKTVTWRAIAGSTFERMEYTFDFEGGWSICQFMAKLATREQL